VGCIFGRRFADGKEELLANLAAELVQLRVDAIVTDSTPSARAAKNATQTVPIVMAVLAAYSERVASRRNMLT